MCLRNLRFTIYYLRLAVVIGRSRRVGARTVRVRSGLKPRMPREVPYPTHFGTAADGDRPRSAALTDRLLAALVARFRFHILRFTFRFIFLGLCTLAAQETNQVYPIDLPTAMRLAGAQNLEIQIARERLKEAEAERTSATERFFPWIAPGVTYHRRDGVAQAVPAGTISDAHFQSYSPGVALAAQLDLGDAIYKNLAAKQLVKAADQALETQRQDAVLNAARSYFDLTKAKGVIEVANAALKTSQDYEQQLHEAVIAGIAFKGDELRIQTQTKQYQISLRQAAEQQRVAAVELARLLHL